MLEITMEYTSGGATIGWGKIWGNGRICAGRLIRRECNRLKLRCQYDHGTGYAVVSVYTEKQRRRLPELEKYIQGKKFRKSVSNNAMNLTYTGENAGALRT